jgi:hypothetical protein
MNAILKNPYRTVGLLVGATAREQERQVKRLKQFLKAEQDPPEDFSFPTLGNLDRTLDKVNEAALKLYLGSDKMTAALFWFYDGKTARKTDEEAFNAIKEADLDQVVSIWGKLTSNGEVSQRNASAYNNLGTLYLSGVLEKKASNKAMLNPSPLYPPRPAIIFDDEILEGTNANVTLLEKGISLKLKFLESAFFTELQHLAADEKNYKPTKKDIQIMFLKSLQSEIENGGGISLNKFLDILTKHEFTAKEEYLKGFVQKPIEQIEKKIEEAKTKRKANKASAVIVGKALFEQTFQILNQLKSIIGASDLKFSSISDKVSDEILQCGIDYFSHYKDSSTDAGSASMELFRKAEKLAIGNIATQRCQENTENLQKWIDDKPQRDKQKLIGNDLKFITDRLERFQNLKDTIENANDLLESCKAKLFNIRTSIGSTDEFYLKISGAIVNNVQGMLVTVVNDEQELFQFAVNPTSANMQNIAEITARRYGANRTNATEALTDLLNDRYLATENLKVAIKGAVAVSKALGELDMDSQLRIRYNQNNSTLLALASQLGISTSNSRSSLSTSRPSKSSRTLSPSSPSSPASNDETPEWLKFVAAIILFIILIKACNG